MSKKTADKPFITTVKMSLALRGELDAVRARWAAELGRRPSAREIIVAALERFVAAEQRRARKS